MKNADLGFINNDNLGDSFVAIRGEADDLNGAFIRLRLFHGLVEFLSVESHHLYVRSGRVGGVFLKVYPAWRNAEAYRALQAARASSPVISSRSKYGKPRRRK